MIDKFKRVFLIKTIIMLVLLMLSSVSGAQMSTVQMTTSTVSTTDPYCSEDGYVVSVLGSRCSSEVSVTDDIPENVSDWVLIELRAVEKDNGVDNATTATVIARQSAFLLNTGYIVDAVLYRNDKSCLEFVPNTDNCPLVDFNFTDPSVVAGKDLYVVVRHINHLDVISKEVLSTTDTSPNYSYDFTSDDARGGSLATGEVEIQGDNKKAIYIGDVNGDTNINAADYLEIILSKDTDMNTDASDINFDGKVDDADITNFRLRQNLGRASQVP